MTQPVQPKWLTAFVCFLILSGALLRVARHYGWVDLPPNVAPVAGMAMFAAVYLPRRLSILVPIGLMLISDALIGWYTPGVVATVYGSFGVSLALGWWVKRRVSPGRILGATLTGSVVFFLLTNAAVWKFEEAYAPGLTGLIDAYVAGLPFFRNTLLGDLAYTGLLFGVYQAVVIYWRKRTMVPDSAPIHG